MFRPLTWLYSCSFHPEGGDVNSLTFQRLLLTLIHSHILAFKKYMYKDFLFTNAPTKTFGPKFLADK